MRAHFKLPSVVKEEDDGRPPIKVKFEIPYFTVSGLNVSSDKDIFVFSWSNEAAHQRSLFVFT